MPGKMPTIKSTRVIVTHADRRPTWHYDTTNMPERVVNAAIARALRALSLPQGSKEASAMMSRVSYELMQLAGPEGHHISSQPLLDLSMSSAVRTIRIRCSELTIEDGSRSYSFEEFIATFRGS